MGVYQITIENKKPLEHAIDMAIASARRAVKQSTRPEFNVVYEKEINMLHAAKLSIVEVPPETKPVKER